MTKRTRKQRCAYCKKTFPVSERGRRPKYCCPAHRQRAYEKRRARKWARMPSLLLGKDIDDMRTRSGIERVVVVVLRNYGLIPPAPPPKGGPRLRVVKD